MAQGVDLCAICLEPVRELTLLSNCDHQFCFACIRKWATTNAACPQCRQNIVTIVDKNMKEHYIRLPKASKRFQPRPSPSADPVRPSVWRSNNPNPNTDYGEMREDDEAWSGESSPGSSVIDLIESSLEESDGPSSDEIACEIASLASRFQNKSGVEVITSRHSLTIRRTNRRETLRNRRNPADIPPSPDVAPQRISRLPTKPNKK
jgi:hypothetical protein